jgi:hypothetical protein
LKGFEPRGVNGSWEKNLRLEAGVIFSQEEKARQDKI